MKHMRSIFLLFIFVAALLAACADGVGQVNETPGIGTDTIGTDDGLGGTDEGLATGTETGGTTGTQAVTATRQATSTVAVATTEAVGGTGTQTSGQGTQVGTGSQVAGGTKVGAGTGTPAAGGPQGVEDDETDPSRISNLLDFRVVFQDGEDIGEVDDLVLDFSQQQVVYLVVGSGGLLGVGEKDILIPWEAVRLPIGRGSDSDDPEDDKVITLVEGVIQDTIDNAPDFDVNNDFPQVGTVDVTWDTDLSSYWADFTSGVGGQATQTSGTPAAGTTTSPKTTSTVTAGSTDTAGSGTGMTQGVDMMGVVLATDVLGYDFRIGAGGGVTTGDDMDTTGTPAGGATVASTPAAGGTQTGTDTGTSVGAAGETTDATIDDVIIDVDSGEILYIVIRTDLGVGDERLIPVPVDVVKWDNENEAFVLDMDVTDLQDAPNFTDGAYLDTTITGWDDEFTTFWADFDTNGTSTP